MFTKFYRSIRLTVFSIHIFSVQIVLVASVSLLPVVPKTMDCFSGGKEKSLLKAAYWAKEEECLSAWKNYQLCLKEIERLEAREKEKFFDIVKLMFFSKTFKSINAERVEDVISLFINRELRLANNAIRLLGGKDEFEEEVDEFGLDYKTRVQYGEENLKEKKFKASFFNFDQAAAIAGTLEEEKFASERADLVDCFRAKSLLSLEKEKAAYKCILIKNRQSLASCFANLRLCLLYKKENERSKMDHYCQKTLALFGLMLTCDGRDFRLLIDDAMEFMPFLEDNKYFCYVASLFNKINACSQQDELSSKIFRLNVCLDFFRNRVRLKQCLDETTLFYSQTKADFKLLEAVFDHHHPGLLSGSECNHRQKKSLLRKYVLFLHEMALLKSSSGLFLEAENLYKACHTHSASVDEKSELADALIDVYDDWGRVLDDLDGKSKVYQKVICFIKESCLKEKKCLCAYCQMVVKKLIRFVILKSYSEIDLGRTAGVAEAILETLAIPGVDSTNKARLICTLAEVYLVKGDMPVSFSQMDKAQTFFLESNETELLCRQTVYYCRALYQLAKKKGGCVEAKKLFELVIHYGQVAINIISEGEEESCILKDVKKIKAYMGQSFLERMALGSMDD